MNRNLSRTRKLVIMGVMLGIIIVMDLTNLTAIPLGAVSATIAHIPVIIVGIILGPVYGLVMGLFYGLVSLIHAATRPIGPLDVLFINPLVSVLPRMLIGVVAYYGYALVRKLMGNRAAGQSIGATVGGILGSITNTVFVLGALYLLYVNAIIEKLDLANKSDVGAIFIGIITSNALIEAVVAGIITTAICVAYYGVYRDEINRPIKA